MGVPSEWRSLVEGAAGRALVADHAVAHAAGLRGDREVAVARGAEAAVRRKAEAAAQKRVAADRRKRAVADRRKRAAAVARRKAAAAVRRRAAVLVLRKAVVTAPMAKRKTTRSLSLSLDPSRRSAPSRDLVPSPTRHATPSLGRRRQSDAQLVVIERTGLATAEHPIGQIVTQEIDALTGVLFCTISERLLSFLKYVHFERLYYVIVFRWKLLAALSIIIFISAFRKIHVKDVKYFNTMHTIS